MMIIVRSHKFPFARVSGGTLGRDLLSGWASTHERAVLAGMQAEYAFRGYHSYRLSGEPGCPTYWCDYVLAINQNDFDLIKIALGRVRMFECGIDEITDIASYDVRERLRMTLDEAEEWEIELSSPPKKPVIMTHHK